MRRIKNLIIIIIILIIFPCIAKAATELGASTQNPVVGSYVYVQLDANYPSEYSIADFHVYVTYDTSYLKLEDVIWLQKKATYSTSSGQINIDKDTTSAWHVGAICQFKFTVLKSGNSKVSVNREVGIESHYTNGDIIGQTFAGVTISGTEPSTNTIIGSLYVKGYTISPTFSKTTYSYKLTVPSNVTSVEIVATKGDSKQTITGTGTKSLEYGDNRARVVVTAQDGSSRTYEIMITRTDDRTGDVSLKSLSVSNTNISYLEGQTTYETTVSRSIDSVLITARTTDSNATLTGTGKKSLEIGTNTFTLNVASSDGKSQTYTIIINRSNEELQTVTQSSKLLSLKVNNLILDLSDERTKWLYGISKDYEEITIDAVTESSTATVKIDGNEKLTEGINIVTITVTETNEEETEYTLVIYKNPSNATVINDLTNIDTTGNILYSTTEDSSHTISSSVLSYLNNNNAKLYYNVVNIYNGLLYQAIIPSNLSVSETDATITKVAETPLTYETSLPEGVEITIYLEDIYPDDTTVKIYTYDEIGNYTLLTEGIKIKNSYITFQTNGQKYYVITTSTLIAEESTLSKIIDKYKKYIAIPIIIIIAIILSIYLINKNKKHKNKNEPLY